MSAEAEHAFIADYLGQSAAALHAFTTDRAQIAVLTSMTQRVAQAMQQGGKLLLAGNGGSAGDAQHIAAEFTGRMLYDRAPLAAVALTTDTSALTAIGNDYGFDQVFVRQVIALGRPGDVLLGISTSGNSLNVLHAIDAATERGIATLGFSGADGGAMAGRVDMLLRAPSRLTPVIQQIHMIAGHLLCALVERALHPRP